MIRLRHVIAAIVTVALTSSPVLQGQQPARFEFRYHTYAESTAMLKALASAYPQLAKVYSIGKSATGTKELWCIEVGNQKTGPAEAKPGLYFDGNQHASEVVGGEVTLHLAHYLLTNYGREPMVTKLVDTRTVYIVQRGDPDGAEAVIAGKIDWDPEKAPGARDADGDGRKGEDGPEDIDNDGNILKIRVPDADGQWKPYPGDPRLLVRREKEDRQGPFFKVLDEGLDNDGDGQLNEDPPEAQFISNRNYPTFWSSDEGRFRGEGDYPLQEHNARLLVEFIVAHPNIAEVESFHTTSGIHLRPYASRPDAGLPPQDHQDFAAILAKGTELTGYPVASIYNDFTDLVPGLSADEQPGLRHGVFIDWGYVHQGVFAVTTELWTLEPFINEVGGWGDIPRNKPLFAIPGRYNRPDVQAAFLKWLDAHKGEPMLSGQGFVDWKPLKHPTLGNVEIGGFTRYILRNPPPGPLFEKLAVDQAKFAVVQSLTTPLVKIRNVTVTRAAGDAGSTGPAPQWVVTADVVNEGYLDTSMEQARIARLSRPVEVSIELPAGATTQSPKTVSFEFLRGTRGSSAESLYRASWRVSAPASASLGVVVKSQKGGTDRRTVTLGTRP